MISPNAVVDTLARLSAAEQREVLARLWAQQARLVAYAPEQETYLPVLRATLENGVLARRENEADGTFEIYGPDRTYYVTMTLAREFVGLLSSWPPEQPPREIHLTGGE